MVNVIYAKCLKYYAECRYAEHQNSDYYIVIVP
jgi:hypothetical protein